MLRDVLNRAASQFDIAVTSALLSRSARARARSRSESLGHADRMSALAAIANVYDRPGHYEAGHAFFAPAGPVEPSLARVPSLEPRYPGGDVFDATWPSPPALFDASIADRYLAHEPNKTGAARLFLHRDRPRAAVILIHGYRAGHYLLEERIWPVQWLYERGLDVGLFVLPFHAVRAKKGGAPLFPSSDPRFTIEGFRQAVCELRALLRFFQARGSQAIGVMGMSLGGYTAALLATVEPGLAFAVPIIPLASIADVARAGGRLVGAAHEQELQHEAIERAHRVVSPLARPLAIPRDRALIIAASGDRITPVGHARKLARHLDVPLEELDGGHLLQFWRRAAFRAAGRLIGGLGHFDPR
jgi:pimeloyl-ACP methyl ester carboxylesterase